VYRTIRAEKVIGTAASLTERVRARFPESGLLQVAEEILAVAREADDRCREIRRPAVGLRVAVVLMIVLGIGGLAAVVVQNVRLTDSIWDISNFAQASEALLGDVVFLGATLAFLVTLENRIKRRRALAAVNELRALAHIIDMHQLTKDPEMVLGPHAPTQASPARNMSAFELNRYLDYCSEMLALVSKVGALYVQTFPDPQALASVDEIEGLTTALSQKIWQKIMILDRYVARERPTP
jgi:hypothetical protein